MDKDVPRAHHDMGGVSRFMCDPVDPEPHTLTDFDRDVDALRQVLARKRMMTVDELRRGIEFDPGGGLPPPELLQALDPLHHRQSASPWYHH